MSTSNTTATPAPLTAEEAARAVAAAEKAVYDGVMEYADPDDEDAVTINSRLRDGATALQLAARRLQDTEQEEVDQTEDMYFGFNLREGRKEFNAKMDDVLGFYGVTSLKKVTESGIKYRTNGRVSSMTEQAMSHIISFGEGGSGIKFFSPGKTVDQQLLPAGVNVYVLEENGTELIVEELKDIGDKIDRLGRALREKK